VWVLSYCLGSAHHRLLKGMLLAKVEILNYFTSASHSDKPLRDRSKYMLLGFFAVGLLVLSCLFVFWWFDYFF